MYHQQIKTVLEGRGGKMLQSQEVPSACTQHQSTLVAKLQKIQLEK